ncbi:MAG: polysaccharide biosynthesis/export family protein [Thermodesulfobacteriota bacterium]
MRSLTRAGASLTFFPHTIAVFAAALVISGCVIPVHRAVVNEVPPHLAQCVTEHFPTSLYRLAAGDVLELLYLTIPTVTQKPYQLGIKDQLDIEFAFNPELNRTVRVRPDGKISIPRKKDVHVAGLTADQISEKLRKIYSDLLRDPEITVTVREFDAKLAEVQRAIATSTFGQAREIRVAPDGNIAIPLIPQVRAEGLTVPQLTQEVNRQYGGMLGDIKVSVLLREVSGHLAFVDGMVSTPGVYPMRGRMTVQQAIALAGGMRPEAEPRSVLVVSKAPNGRYITRLADMTNLSSFTDYVLGAGDLVFVPRSLISRADVWVDQNIKQLLLFNGWSWGLSSDMGRVVAR